MEVSRHARIILAFRQVVGGDQAASCQPLAFYLTPGQTADIKGAVMFAYGY